MPDEPSLERAESGDGHSVYYAGRQFYSPDTPIATAKERARRQQLPANSLVLVDSPLLGYGLDELLARISGRSWIIAVERDQKLMALTLSHITPQLLHDQRLQLVRAETPEAVVSFLNQRGIGGVRRVVRVSLSGAGRLYPSFYREVERRVEAAIQEYWQNRATLIRLGNTWIKNLVANLSGPAIAAEAEALDRFNAALLVGAGPSSESLYSLRSPVPANVAVFAVDTALPILEASGLRCDAVVAVEAQWPNILDFVGLTRLPNTAFLDLTGLPSAARFLQNCKRSFFLSRFADCRLVERLEASGVPTIPPLGSVGVIAAYLARQAGFMRVAAVGFDFAYPPGKPHARGAPTHRRHLVRCGRTTPGPNYRIAAGHLHRQGKGDEVVDTDVVLSTYANLMADLAGAFDLFLDCSKTGLPMGTINVTKLDEALSVLSGLSVPSGASRSTPRVWSGTVRPSSPAGHIIADETLRLKRLLEALEGEDKIDAARRALPGGDLDYLTLAYADREDLDPDNASARRRVAISARSVLELWSRAAPD